MSDERDPREIRADEALPSVEQVARLDAYLDQLAAERRPESHALTQQEARERMLAAQLRLARDDIEAPSPAFLQSLEREVGRAVAQQQRRTRPRAGLSRGRFLRTIAAVAGGAGVGIAGAEGLALVQEAQRPQELVEQGNEAWYEIALAGEVPPGGAKAFSAGGVLGFLLNDGGRLHAVSAICTHMGCRLKPSGAAELRCLCHGSRFNRRGEVLSGLAPTALPEITVREVNGRVYALGTGETL